jgi:predicted dehydrogenase
MRPRDATKKRPGGMRVVLISVSHRPMPFFLDPCPEMPPVAVVGVCDPDGSCVAAVAAKVGCKASTDYKEMCATLTPDFAFALARHSDMAELARFLIGHRIPFAMEKPCAINAAEAAEIAARAAAAGVFAPVPYGFRYSPLLETIQSMNRPVQYAMFKFIGGIFERYHQQRAEWITHRKTSAAGRC